MLIKGGFQVSRAGRRRSCGKGKGHSRIRRHHGDGCSGGVAGRGCSLLCCPLSTQKPGIQAGVMQHPCCCMSVGPAHSSHTAAATPVLLPFLGMGRVLATLLECFLEPLRLTKPLLAVGMGQGWCPMPGLHTATQLQTIRELNSLDTIFPARSSVPKEPSVFNLQL